MHHDHTTTGARENPDRMRTVSRIVFLSFAAIAGYYLVTEHRAHLFGILPFALLAACPLLHLFHHRGHRHGSQGGQDAGNASPGGEHRH